MNVFVLPTSLARLKRDTGNFARSKFAANLGSLGGAQLAIRISRLLTTIFLSRLLLPEDFGLAAIVLTVYELVAIFTRNGIAAKVVQVAEAELPVVAMTAYHMTWLICGALMVLQFLIAFPIAWIYDDSSIAWPIASMGLIYLATPLCNIQAALQQREGNLGRFALANATQVITDNLLTVVFAFLGLGMWAIILPKILVAPIWVIFMRSGHTWRPKKGVSPSLFHGWRDIARFGRRVLGVELLTTLQANMDNILVGYFLGMNALGLYYFAFNSGLGITLGLINAAGVAVYPHLCEAKDDREALRKRTLKTMTTLSVLLVPLILLQAMLSPLYVPIVFGTQWVAAVPALTLICLSALVRPVANVSSQLLKTVGKPDFELKWQFATTLVLGVTLVAACQIDIVAVAAAVFLVQTVMLGCFVISTWSMVFRRTTPQTHTEESA
jgi:teichuronic acid exporter